MIETSVPQRVEIGQPPLQSPHATALRSVPCCDFRYDCPISSPGRFILDPQAMLSYHLPQPGAYSLIKPRNGRTFGTTSEKTISIKS